MAAAQDKILLDAAENKMQGFIKSMMLPDDLHLYEKDADIKQLTAQLKMLPDLLRVYNEKNLQTNIKR